MVPSQALPSPDLPGQPPAAIVRKEVAIWKEFAP